MANVRITKEEAKDPFKVPHVCMKCGVPPVIAKPTWFWRKKPEEKVPPDQGGLVAILMILGLDAIVNLFMNSGYEKVVLYTPLCKSCDEEFTADELARLEDVGANSFALSGVCDAFAVALETKRDQLRTAKIRETNRFPTTEGADK